MPKQLKDHKDFVKELSKNQASSVEISGINYNVGENMSKELNKYSEFVETLTSKPSSNIENLIERLKELDDSDAVHNLPMVVTGGIALPAEAGELDEIVKKILFQGKPLNEDSIFHMKRELGDIFFYLIMTCNGLGLDPYEVIDENIRKLESRYPGGKFTVNESENRKEGDL